MLVLVYFAAYAPVLAGIAWLAHRHDRRGPVPQLATGELPAWIHVGLVGDTTTAEPVRGLVRMAPLDDRQLAIEISTPEGWPLLAIPADQVDSVRGWTDGRICASFGAPLRPFRASWPVRSDRPVWELQLTDTTGLGVRCYGAPEDFPAADLDRLDNRMHAVAVRTAR